MKVWTHHPSTFPLTSPDLVVDARKSIDYRSQEYRDAIRKLHQHLGGETQFLWCLTSRNTFVRHCASIDLIEWELDAPASQIDAFLGDHRLDSSIANGLHGAPMWASCFGGVVVASMVVCRMVVPGVGVLCGRELGRHEQRGCDDCGNATKFH
ncbi:hypothetical protein [Stieleria magnilauensis]|uniref:hypothetical protein n=1 Tax=Stieleria magnilauensis TaxID=2527963 RepID=UPI003AF83B84